MPLIIPNRIETGRLLVRPMLESDLLDLLDVNSNEDVTALLPYRTWTSMADAVAWFARTRTLEAGGSAIQFVVVLRATGRAIGTCLLFRFEPGSSRIELGYVLGRRFWGQGLMREAVGGLLDRAFATMGIRRVEAEVDTRNAASARLMRHLGFTKEGLLRQRWVAKGEVRDVEMFGLLRDEWPGRHPSDR